MKLSYVDLYIKYKSYIQLIDRFNVINQEYRAI